jgi:DNA-binding SARP family transcriptional activator
MVGLLSALPGTRPGIRGVPAPRDEPCGLAISVLGPLAVTGTAAQLQPKQAELIVALALAGDDGLAGDTLRGRLGSDPDHPKSGATMRQAITRARRRLGPGPGGREWILHAGNARYVLHPDAGLDWDRFRQLAARGRGRRDPVPLRAAVALLRGQPMEGIYYWWLDAVFLDTMRAEITSAAGLLSGMELHRSDPAAACRAARAGLTADTACEPLWRALMLAEDGRGNTAGVHDAWRGCLAAISEIAPGGQPHPETARTYRRLTRSRTAG